MSKTRVGRARPAGGVEVAYSAPDGIQLLGRVGAPARPSGSSMSPLSFGGGARARHVALDYAYQGFAGLGGTHRVGVRWWR
jgi:hypothetical protein